MKFIKTQQMFRGDVHNIFSENVNKTALSFNDERRLQ